jgi:hypothetical protein
MGTPARTAAATEVSMVVCKEPGAASKRAKV